MAGQATYLVEARSSTTGAVLATFDTVALKTLRYERLLNDVGSFQLTLPLTDARVWAVAQQDVLVDVVRSPEPGVEHVEGSYLVEFVRPLLDEDEQPWVIVSGYSLEFLLLRRLIDPRNDPLVAGGYSTKSGPAGGVMVELVTQQAGGGAALAQRVPYLTALASGGVGETVGGRWAWENLLEVLQGLTRAGNVDFQITRPSAVNLVFQALRIGTDKTRTTHAAAGEPFVLFSPAFGNVRQPDLTLDWRKAVTTVYLRGQGVGEHTTIYEAYSPSVSATPYAYSALAADARQVEDGDATQFLTQATSELSKHRAIRKLAFEVPDAAREYGAVWTLGDQVTVAWEAYQADMRITGVQVEVSEDAERVTPTLEGQA